MPKITRKRLIVMLGVALVLATVLLSWSRRTEITEESFRRIRFGMRRTEVEAIFGPPGNYASGSGSLVYAPTEYTSHGGTVSSAVFFHASHIHDTPNKHLAWRDDRGSLVVVFDQDDTVKEAEISISYGERPGTVDRFVRRFKRQWQTWYPNGPG